MGWSWSHPSAGLWHPTPEIFAWNNLVARQGGAVGVYRRLLRHGCRPDTYTFPLLLRLINPEPSSSVLSQLHGHIILLGLSRHPHVLSSLICCYSQFIPSQLLSFLPAPLPDLPTSNALLSSLLRAGHHLHARQLFNSMPCRNVVSWSSLIHGHAALGQPRAALSFFARMLADPRAPSPNPFTLSSVLSACAASAALHLGLWTHAYISRRRFPLAADPVLSTSLIHMYARCGRPDSARAVFTALPPHARDAAAWTAMISGLAVNGLAEEALSLFRQMTAGAGPAPNPVTLLAVLQACTHCGLVREGERYFAAMVSVFGMSPSVEHFGCVVDLYSRAGFIDRAWSTVRSMPMRPDALIWGALLAGSKTHGDILACEAAIRGLMEIDPGSSAAYVMLSNAYAKMGRRDQATSIRRLMERKGVKKIPGCSAIEVDGRIHEFFAGDVSAPELHLMVDEMLRRLRGAGYICNIKELLMDFEGEEEGKELALWAHSEKLAVAFGLMKTRPGTEMRVAKNLRICADCHEAIRLISRVYDRDISVRDCNRFHHFKYGTCSCKNYW